jgi:hypothetical protein
MSIDDIRPEEWDQLGKNNNNKVTDIKPDMVNKPKHYQGVVECITLFEKVPMVFKRID